MDCDLVVSDGVPVYGAITDNWPTVGARRRTEQRRRAGSGGARWEPAGRRRCLPPRCATTPRPNHTRANTLFPPPPEPYFNETGSNCPSILPRKQQMELLDLCVKSVQVGRGRGVTHG